MSRIKLHDVFARSGRWGLALSVFAVAAGAQVVPTPLRGDDPRSRHITLYNGAAAVAEFTPFEFIGLRPGLGRPGLVTVTPLRVHEHAVVLSEPITVINYCGPKDDFLYEIVLGPEVAGLGPVVADLTGPENAPYTLRVWGNRTALCEHRSIRAPYNEAMFSSGSWTAQPCGATEQREFAAIRNVEVIHNGAESVILAEARDFSQRTRPTYVLSLNIETLVASQTPTWSVIARHGIPRVAVDSEGGVWMLTRPTINWTPAKLYLSRRVETDVWLAVPSLLNELQAHHEFDIAVQSDCLFVALWHYPTYNGGGLDPELLPELRVLRMDCGNQTWSEVTLPGERRRPTVGSRLPLVELLDARDSGVGSQRATIYFETEQGNVAARSLASLPRSPID